MKYSHKKKPWLLKREETLSVAEDFLLLPSTGEKYGGDTWDFLPSCVEDRAVFQVVERK